MVIPNPTVHLTLDPPHPAPVTTAPAPAPQTAVPSGMGSRVAFVLYAAAMLAALGAITALIERAAS